MACPHSEAYLHWLPEIEMWERRCPCGLNAYGVTLADLDRVFRRKADEAGWLLFHPGV